MLPGAHQGNSDHSELFNSLKAYLNNGNRLQPFIGLSSIIECVNGGAPQRDAFYICEVCVCRLDMADMRNHIMGSLHRYNYTKTRHSELLSELGEGSCLSKLAWPLMDVAKKIEEKEGPGNVQVVEFDKSSYQQMESQGDNANNIIEFLKETLKQTEPEISEVITSKMWEQSPSNRVVMYSPRMNPAKVSSNLLNSLQQNSTSDSSSESFVESSSFLSDYAGQAPLIGLVRVIECKSEAGQTYCFLCHCCRVRSLKNDIIDHLSSTSHITNYLMETHPERLEMVDLNDISQLELLAEKLNKENEEADTTKLKVVQVPESLCIQMTGKSYHWCVKTLGWNNSDFPVKYIDVKRQKWANFPQQMHASKEARYAQVPKEKKTTQKSIKKTNTVFKVTLPLTRGSLLVERTSFSEDHLPSFIYSPTEHFDESLPPTSQCSPDPQTVTCDFSSGLFDRPPEKTDLSSQYQQNVSTGFPDHNQGYIKQEKDEQWNHLFKDQNCERKTNIEVKTGMFVDNLVASNTYNTQIPLFQSEYVPPHDMWQAGMRENERNVPHPYFHQQPQYIAPDYFPQQHIYSGYVSGDCRMIPQVPQPENSFPHNNSFRLTDSQSFSNFYSEQIVNSQHYTSYQISAPTWATHQPQQPLCYDPCCVPIYPGTAFPNVAESSSSNAIFYPTPNLYSNHQYPC